MRLSFLRAKNSCRVFFSRCDFLLMLSFTPSNSSRTPWDFHCFWLRTVAECSFLTVIFCHMRWCVVGDWGWPFAVWAMTQNTQEVKINAFYCRIDKTTCEFSVYSLPLTKRQAVKQIWNTKRRKNFAECHCWRSQLKSSDSRKGERRRSLYPTATLSPPELVPH